MTEMVQRTRTELRADEEAYRMQAPVKRGFGLVWFAIAVCLFALDRALKALAIARGVDATPGAVSFSLFRNGGIAFSLPLPAYVFWPAAGVIFLGLLVLFARLVRRDLTEAGMLCLVILGATSNLVDRALYASTTDYLLFFDRSAVNVADGMILAGLLALYLRSSRKKQRTPASAT
jgi:lipoprotein signal peptidase